MKITKQQLKEIISEEIEKTLNENESDHLNLNENDELKGKLSNAFKIRSDPEYLLNIMSTRYPIVIDKIKKRGLGDRYVAAAKAADKQHGALLDPNQYLRQPDELDAYLGLSQKAPAAAPSSAGGKQAVVSNVQKMYDDLRTYDTKFQKDPEIRKKYEAALGAINSLLRSL